MTGNLVHKRVDASGAGEKSAELLAIRTAELIRASLIDIFIPPAPPPTAPAPAPASTTPAPPPPSRPRRVQLRAAAGPTLMLTRGATPSLTPMLDLGLLINQRWLARAVATGLGSAARIDDGSDWADLHQSTLTAQLQYRRRPVWGLAVAAGLGLGVLHVAGSGHVTLPSEGVGVNVSQTSFCGSAGLALALALGSKLELSLEAQALMAVPSANVLAGSGGPAKAGQPTVLVLLGLAVLP
jgi:hypothetical protein